VWFGQRADSQKTPKVCSGKGVEAFSPDQKNNQLFYLIIASFNDPADAKEALRRTKKSGFDKAGILNNGDDNHRVFLGKYKSLKEATFMKEKLPPTYRNAWILKN
jgi:hypothetical protein